MLECHLATSGSVSNSFPMPIGHNGRTSYLGDATLSVKVVYPQLPHVRRPSCCAMK